jgi:Protein of unknown function (DUF3078)
MKKISLLLLLIIFSQAAFSQEIEKVAKAKENVTSVVIPDSLKAWYFGGSGSLSVNQAAFSNWAAGGQNSVGLDAYLNLVANYHKGRHFWANSLNLGYGFNLLGKGSETKLTKSNDKIDLTSAYGYAFSEDKKWLLTVLVNFRTQFSAGYNYPDDSTMISNFMAPGYLVAGLGITYAPAKWFYMYLSPASGRFTFVLDQRLSDAGSFGVEKGKKIRGEFGPYFRANLNKDLSKTINLTTSLALFTNYLKGFGNIDVNWDLLLTMKVNKWLAASITTQLIYDDDIIIQPDPTEAGGPRTQFKELLGIGISYKIH